MSSNSPIYWRSITVGDRRLHDEIKGASSARIVTVTIWSEATDDDEYCESFVVERETVWGPVDSSDWSILVPEPTREQWATGHSDPEEWQKDISNWSAKKFEEPFWKQYTEYWDLSRGRGVASIADGLESLQDQWHELLLERPVEFASESIGLSSPVSAVLGGIVSEHTLPGDTTMKDLKRVVQVTGIVAGLALGNLHMAHVCLASYARDRAMEIVSDELVKLFRGEPEREYPDRFGEGTRPKDGGKSRNAKLQERERHSHLDKFERRYGRDEIEWDEELER